MTQNKLLVYCAYPIIDQSKEPQWVDVLNHVQLENKLLTNVFIYKPFYGLDVQLKLQEMLSLPSATSDLEAVVRLLDLDVSSVPKSWEEALSLESNREFSEMLVLKELWILSKCNIMIADLDLADRGERDMPLTIAKLLKLPIIGVTNKFIQGPWLSAFTTYKTNTLNLPDMLQALANQILSNRKNENNEL
jgi:hypothetical protein